MSITLRIVLIIGAILVLLFVIRKIRKSKFEASDALFWLAFSAILVLIAIVPAVSYAVSDLLGFDSRQARTRFREEQRSLTTGSLAGFDKSIGGMRPGEPIPYACCASLRALPRIRSVARQKAQGLRNRVWRRVCKHDSA